MEGEVVRPEAVTVTVSGSALVVSYPQIKTTAHDRRRISGAIARGSL
jgi:hypothetical protein